MTKQAWEGTRLLVERSWMLFVDGENFTKRGEAAMRTAGAKLGAEGPWLKDVYLWFPGHAATYPILRPIHLGFHFGRALGDSGPPPPSAPHASRAFYYTSMPVADSRDVTAARLALREIGFEPRMFPRRAGKSKAVDIALATDVLTLASEGQYEVAVLFAGDADYTPVVEAVKRLGRHVVVGFFEGEGLGDELRIAADDFLDVTSDMKQSWASFWERRENEARIDAATAAKKAEGE
jgi:hypothetical protein